MSEKIKNKSRLQSFANAGAGVFWAVRNEMNLQIHLVAAAIVIGTGWYFKISKWEWLALFFAIFLVLVCELFNTALEETVDLASQGKYHSSAKIAKDVAAGAVLLAAINAIIIGCIIFGGRIF